MGGGNVLKIVLNEVQGQGTNDKYSNSVKLNQLEKKHHNSQFLLTLSTLHIHNEVKLFDMWIRNYV